MKILAIAFALVCCPVVIAAQDLSFHGRWKLNAAKSDYRGVSLTIAEKREGEYEFTQFGQSYPFRIDGKDHPGPGGTRARWRKLDDRTWETTMTTPHGDPFLTVTIALEGDGRTSTWRTRGEGPTGAAFVENAVFTRTDARSDLVGRWTQQSSDMPTPLTLELLTQPQGGLRYAVVGVDLRCDVKLDGKDYPCTGAVAGEGTTLAAVRNGDTLELTQKLGGAPFVVSTFSVSADGATLTEKGRSADNQTFTSVYDRER